MTIHYPRLDDIDQQDHVLWTQLNQSDEKIRFITLMNVAEEEREALLPWLHYALQHDPSARVRQEAAQRLEGWEDTLTLQSLAHALQDPCIHVIEAATHSLSEVKQLDSAYVLAPYLQSSNYQVKVAILRALKPLRPIFLYDEICQHIKHEHVQVRREAVSALSWLQQAQAISLLADISQYDHDVEVRRIATGGLAYSQHISPELIQALMSSLHAQDWQLRVEAALTTGKLKLQALETTLVTLLQDAYWQVRIAAVRSLGLLKSQSALDGFITNFQHEMSNLRKEVALALGEIGGQQAEQLLLQHVHDPDPEVRKSIRIGLGQIRRTGDVT
ncbi:HEAT repeat domain-containing protein [Acinetobacter ihumii]|uniref:HEAT repeat domain-containing protein n=1 Tax=Acinetobacter ihumii TaxID=2483802 RepID=UPI00102F4A1E|nr:HEAT repeat domain-containing protein [Acinetobacter ihumii]